MKYRFPPEVMRLYRDPRLMVPGVCHVIDQVTDDMIPYDIDAICPKVQRGILGYLGDPPKTKDGYNHRLLVVGSRQIVKTSTTVLGISNLVEFSPGTTGVTIADTRGRSKELFRHAINSYELKPEEYRYPTIPNMERNQLTFQHGGKYVLLSAEQGNAGIGRGAAFLHLSELPFWNDPGDVWFKLSPSFRNRKNALIVAESTPAPAAEPGAEWFKEFFFDAWHGEQDNLFIPLFVAMYESKLNERTWQKDWTPTLEELRLLERHGPKNGESLSAPGNTNYLTLENLAFCRFVLADDPKIRANPELLNTFYPMDHNTCWVATGGGVIPYEYTEYLTKSILVPWDRGDVYKEYEAPDPDAVYVLCLDPSGYGTGDPAAFHVLKVWADAPPEQVAEYETNEHDPPMQALYVARAAAKFNDALIIVESNRDSALSLLQAASSSGGIELVNELGVREQVHVKNLYWSKVGSPDARPGVHSNKKSNPEAHDALIKALIARIVIRGDKTVSQVTNYKRDKDLETPEKQKVLNNDREARGRRKKHHWDRVSALMWGCWAIERAAIPQRYKPVREVDQDQKKERTLEEEIAWVEKRRQGKKDSGLGTSRQHRRHKYGRGRR